MHSPQCPCAMEAIHNMDVPMAAPPQAEAATVPVKNKGGRKRKNPQTRQERVKNKYTNQMYLNYKGQPVQPKVFTPVVACCKKNCHNKISVDRQEDIFKLFMSLGSYNNQTCFLNNLIIENFKKRGKINGESKRNFSRFYTVYGVDVCREFFLKTFQISSKRVNTVVQKNRMLDPLDQRGKLFKEKYRKARVGELPLPNA